MANVTYLLGAGASANCLPVIQNFNERLLIARDILKNKSNPTIDVISINYNSAPNPPVIKDIVTAKKIIEDFDWLLSEAANHQTIDTLAKKYYHNNHKNLFRLKRILIFFFLFEQKLGKTILAHITLKKKPEKSYEFNKDFFDKRYDSFIAALLKNNPEKVEILDNVRVLTWNYDCQFEIALQKYTSIKFKDLKLKYQIFPNASSFTFTNASFDTNKFGLIKLNGSAEYDPFILYNDIERENFLEINNTDDNVLLNSLLDYFKKSNVTEDADNSHLTYFNYSWESAGEFTNKYAAYINNMQTAFSIAQKTDILVVIGYSFPFFNREIDRTIMNSNSIRKVYVQDTDPESRIFTIKESFSALRDTKIQPISFTNSFFLPPEL